MAEYHLDPQELATVYLHAVHGESLDQIAERQGVSAEAVRRTMRTVRRKTDSSTTAQACIRVWSAGEGWVRPLSACAMSRAVTSSWTNAGWFECVEPALTVTVEVTAKAVGRVYGVGIEPQSM
jgi:DNA-binding CsgD family transcriptional regulator